MKSSHIHRKGQPLPFFLTFLQVIWYLKVVIAKGSCRTNSSHPPFWIFWLLIKIYRPIRVLISILWELCTSTTGRMVRPLKRLCLQISHFEKLPQGLPLVLHHWACQLLIHLGTELDIPATPSSSPSGISPQSSINTSFRG